MALPPTAFRRLAESHVFRDENRFVADHSAGLAGLQQTLEVAEHDREALGGIDGLRSGIIPAESRDDDS